MAVDFEDLTFPVCISIRTLSVKHAVNQSFHRTCQTRTLLDKRVKQTRILTNNLTNMLNLSNKFDSSQGPLDLVPTALL